MSNPLFNQMTGNGLLQQLQQFAQSFKGDPRQQIQQMLNSGRITQQQYNDAVQKAQQLQKMLFGK
jgi:hypothetical protein